MEMPPTTKRAKEWFTLALRILGMWELLYAASYLMTALDVSVGLYRPPAGSTFGGAMLHTFGHFFLAAWLLKGAPKITDFFYPDPPPNDKGSDTPTI